MLNEFRSTYITWDKATRRIYSPITANASDSNGRKLNIQVVNSGQVENLTGATLHLYWETKDKVHDGLDAFDTSDISKGEFELFYTTGMLSNVGELNATLVLVDSTGKVVSDWFKITVTRGINEGAIESENSFSSLTQALIDISNLEQNYTPRLNDLTAQLQQTEQELSSQLAQKVDKISDSVTKKSVINGGQLLDLYHALTNPFHQFVGVNFVGDSITWGMGATGNNTSYNVGRNGTLSDIRDNFNSLSFVNLFKRHIGENYMSGATPILSNWTNSPSGEAIATYKKSKPIYFNSPFITQTATGDGEIIEVADNGNLLGKSFRLVKRVGNEGTAQISFVFTGDKIELVFASTPNLADYEIIVDGNSLGVFPTRSGVEGMVDGYSSTRVHEFEYVREKEVIVKIVRIPEFPNATQAVYLEAIRIEKTVRITNQGINGASVTSYLSRAMTGNPWGVGVAVDKKDEFIFCQFGTNDRAITTSKENYYGNKFSLDMNLLINDLSTYGNVILMCANPVSVEEEKYTFTMQDVRNILSSLAKTKNIDFIDNYNIFGSINTDFFLKDNLHLNDFGNQKVFENIIDALGS